MNDAPFCLAFFTDADRIPDPVPIIEALPEKTAVIYRHYRDPNRSSTAEHLLSICRRRRVLFYLAGAPEDAIALGADGVHLPSWRLSNAQSFEGDVNISAACHNKEEIKIAQEAGARAIFLSPVFATESHPGGRSLGVEEFKSLAASCTAPVLGLGGISHKNAGLLSGPNVVGFGAIGAFQPTTIDEDGDDR